MPNAYEPVDLVWTWGSILKVALTTGFFTAALNQSFAWLKEATQHREKDRRTGQVLALSLVQTLTNYAQECSARSRSNRYIADTGGYGDQRIPILPDYQESDPGWRVFPSEIAAAIRDFRNEISNAKRDVAETDELLGPPEAIDSATYQYVRLGFKAWQFSERLRRYYHFCRYSGDLSFANELRSHYRMAHPNLLRRIWRSLPIYKLRRRARQGWRRVLQKS